MLRARMSPDAVLLEGWADRGVGSYAQRRRRAEWKEFLDLKHKISRCTELQRMTSPVEKILDIPLSEAREAELEVGGSVSKGLVLQAQDLSLMDQDP